MKKFLSIFFILSVGLIIFFSSNKPEKQVNANTLSTIELQMNQDGTRVKNDFREALLEFGDEDDTLDSLDYVPEFLK